MTTAATNRFHPLRTIREVRRSDEDDGGLDAGDFSAWLGSVLGAIRDGEPSAVPCDGCTACCTSSQFVHIEPDEADTLAHVPAALLFPAPGRPRGHVLLGFDERGHCPMLRRGRLLDLRAPAPHLPHLRLPGLRRDRRSSRAARRWPSPRRARRWRFRAR